MPSIVRHAETRAAPRRRNMHAPCLTARVCVATHPTWQAINRAAPPHAETLELLRDAMLRFFARHDRPFMFLAGALLLYSPRNSLSY